jgi:hypothetical protein
MNNANAVTLPRSYGLLLEDGVLMGRAPMSKWSDISELSWLKVLFTARATVRSGLVCDPRAFAPQRTVSED